MVYQHQIHSISSYLLRKIVPLVSLIVLVVFLQYYLMTFREFYIIENTFEDSESKNTPVASIDTMHVLLVAYSRTGSSFVGEVMQYIPNTFYHYEPLRYIQRTVLNDGFHKARNLLNNLFNCNISGVDGYMEWNDKNKQYMQIQRTLCYWEECSKIDLCYNGAYIDSFCHNQTIRVIKTVRLNLLEASKLFISHPNLNLKIIYLVRDPRGTMNSRRNNIVNEWCSNDAKCSNLTNFCSDLLDDVKTLCFLTSQRPESFLVIRYEEVSTDPHNFALKLAKFLGFSSVPDKTYKFLKSHTNFGGNIKNTSKTGLDYPYTTFRNSSSTAGRWRKELTFKYVTELQRVCKSTLSAFGYHSYRTATELRSGMDFNTDLQKAIQSTCKAYNR